MIETRLFALTMAPESTIEKQLEDGIRVFDLRIYFDTRLSAFYTHHALRGPALQDILNQILRFCDQRSSSQEFAIFELSHQRWTDNHYPPQVSALIQQTLGKYIWMPKNVDLRQKFDFQTLKGTKLSAITTGRPTMLFVNTEDHLDYPDTVLNVKSESFFPGHEGGQKQGNGLYSAGLSEPSGLPPPVENILHNTFRSDSQNYLRLRAKAQNPQVEGILNSGTAANKIQMDWYTESKSGKLPVPLIIQANYT